MTYIREVLDEQDKHRALIAIKEAEKRGFQAGLIWGAMTTAVVVALVILII